MRGSATLINVVRSLMRPASDRFADFGLSPSRSCLWQGLVVRRGLPVVREGDVQMPLSARRNRLSAAHTADRDPTQKAGERLDAAQRERRLGVEEEDIGKHAKPRADGNVVAAVLVAVDRGNADAAREAWNAEETRQQGRGPTVEDLHVTARSAGASAHDDVGLAVGVDVARRHKDTAAEAREGEETL